MFRSIFPIDLAFRFVRGQCAGPCRYWTILCGCGFAEPALRKLSCWLKQKLFPRRGFVIALSRAIMGASGPRGAIQHSQNG